MFYRMNFFVLFEEWAETPQCDVSTDVMTVRSYFCRKNLISYLARQFLFFLLIYWLMAYKGMFVIQSCSWNPFMENLRPLNSGCSLIN